MRDASHWSANGLSQRRVCEGQALSLYFSTLTLTLNPNCNPNYSFVLTKKAFSIQAAARPTPHGGRRTSSSTWVKCSWRRCA